MEKTWPYWMEETFDELVVKFNDFVVFSLPRDRTLGGGDTKDYTYAKEHIELLIHAAQIVNGRHIAIAIDVENNKFLLKYDLNISIGPERIAYAAASTLPDTLRALANSVDSAQAKDYGGAFG